MLRYIRLIQFNCAVFHMTWHIRLPVFHVYTLKCRAEPGDKAVLNFASGNIEHVCMTCRLSWSHQLRLSNYILGIVEQEHEMYNPTSMYQICLTIAVQN